ELLHQFFAITAPADIILYGDRLDAGTGHRLIARVQDFFRVLLRHVHLTLNHAYARTLDAIGHAEYRTGDRDAAVRRRHIEMSRTALCGLYDDAAAAEPDGHVAGRLGRRETGTLAEFDDAAVLQLDHGVGVLRSADLNTIRKLLPGGQNGNAGRQ